MSDISGRSFQSLGLRRQFALVFALVAILPILVFWYILNEHQIEISSVWEFAFLCLVISTLGYVLLMKITRRIETFSDELRRLEQGETTTLKGDGIAELSEMAQIAGSFQSILTNLRESTIALERLVFQFSSLTELIEVSARIPNIDELLNTVLRKVLSAVNAEIGSIMLLTGDPPRLRIECAHGLPPELKPGSRSPLEGTVSGHVIQTGLSVLVTDIENDPRFGRKSDTRYGNGSFISMPLRAQDRIIGVLNLARKADNTVFGANDLKFINAILSHIGFALDNARLLDVARSSAAELQRKAQLLTEAQERMIQSEKLSSLGELVAAVAHELNNPLAGILGFAEHLAAAGTDDTREMAGNILKEATRCKHIVQNFLIFSRRHQPEMRPLDLNRVLRSTLELKAYALEVDNIKVELNLQETSARVQGDPYMMQQVILNLLNNGHQAMAGQPSGTFRISSEVQGALMRISVTDTGCGIPEENLGKIFDPFFTTRTGSGNGLGLSVSYGIIANHHGEIYARSIKDQGTTMVIELPIVVGEVSQAISPSPSVSVELDGCKILVVDDEPVIRSLLRRTFEISGCSVTTSANGEEAVEMIRSKDWDIVICDLRMPGMNAEAVYREVGTVKPHMLPRFVYITGDISTDRSQLFFAEAGNALVHKPFTAAEILEAAALVFPKITNHAT